MIKDECFLSFYFGGLVAVIASRSINPLMICGLCTVCIAISLLRLLREA